MVSMLIHRNMGMATRYDMHRASWALRKRLQRDNPGVLIYGGIDTDLPDTIIIRSSKLIEVPKEFKYNNTVYTVSYEVRGEYEYRDSTNS